MGTRSLTVINNEWDNEEICVLYRQYDGYPQGHGTDLLNFLKDMHIVNGMNNKNMKLRISNGMDCLAAQIVAHFKQEPGYFYLQATGTRDVGEQFIYTLYTEDKKTLKIKVEDMYNYGHILFDGDIKQYDEWLNTSESPKEKEYATEKK